MKNVLVTCVIDGDIHVFKCEDVTDDQIIKISHRRDLYQMVDLASGDILRATYDGVLMESTPDTIKMSEVMELVDETVI